MQKQVPKARRNANIIVWHPSGVRPPEGTLPGGRSPLTLNDHRLLSANPSGWRKPEFVFARALSWADTYHQMAQAEEDWSDWECLPEGLTCVPGEADA